MCDDGGVARVVGWMGGGVLSETSSVRADCLFGVID